MKFFGYIIYFTAIIFLLVFGIRGILNAKKVRDSDLKAKESSWYFTKTLLGKSALKYEKERKDGVFNIWISSLVAVLMALLLLYFFVSNIIQKL